MNNNNMPQTRNPAQEKYNVARANLLLMLILTIVNLILLMANAGVMLLFSATAPYIIVSIGVISEINVILIICLLITAIILITYFLCWLFSRYHYGWMVAALVLFSIDTLMMAGMYILAQDISGILDVVIHIFVLYYLIVGVRYGYKLKEQPATSDTKSEATEESFSAPGEEVSTESTSSSDSVPLRKANNDIKYRVLLEHEYLGHHICYRRVKRVNELVIDGYVYDDVEMLIETAHALNARLDGHSFQVGFNGHAQSYLRVDGQKIASKLRLY